MRINKIKIREVILVGKIIKIAVCKNCDREIYKNQYYPAMWFHSWNSDTRCMTQLAEPKDGSIYPFPLIGEVKTSCNPRPDGR